MTEKKLRILLAEGAAGEAATALRVLFPGEQGRLQLTVVSAVSTLLPTINVVTPEVIFLDLSLARPDPLDAVRLVHRSAPAIPLVVVAEPTDKDYAARSLSEGAMDCVLKGFLDARTLDRVLRAALEENTLDGLADLLRDRLTGLYIREGFLTLGLVSFLDKVISRNIEIKVVTAALDPIKADPAQIEQVLMNLCLNARDAMPQGGGY